jgi:hypothetical protein
MKPAVNPVVELLAEELHRNYRTAEKALNKQTHSLWRAGVLFKNENRLLHDHGWTACGKQAYFRKRAAQLIRRSQIANPETLGEAECALAATVLIRRLSVQGDLKVAPVDYQALGNVEIHNVQNLSPAMRREAIAYALRHYEYA